MADPCATRALMRRHDHRALAARCVRAEAQSAALVEEVTRLTAEKVAAQDHERARILDLVQTFPRGADGPSDAMQRESWVLETVVAQIKREVA